MSVSLSFLTGARAGLERASSALLLRCLLGNNRCLLLFRLVDGHHHRVRRVVIKRRGRGYRFHVGDLVVVACRPSSASSPWRWRVGGVIVARRPPLRRRSTRSKHGGERRSRVVMVRCRSGRPLLSKNKIVKTKRQTATITSPETPKHLLIIIIIMTCDDVFISKFDVLASTFQHKFHIVEF